jgi:hypothetical protein
MQTQLTLLPPPTNQKAKILLALINKPYISEGEDFPRMNGFRMRLSELRELLAEKQVTIHHAKYEFITEENKDGWMYRHFLLGADLGKAIELYNYLNK